MDRKYPGALFKKPVVLTWDQFRAQKTESTNWFVKAMNTEIAIIPGGLSSQLQPLDVSVNKSLENLYATRVE